MVRYEDFLDAVRERLGDAGVAEARLAVEDLIDDVLGEPQPNRTPPSPDREGSPRRPPAGPVPGTGDRGRREEEH